MKKSFFAILTGVVLSAMSFSTVFADEIDDRITELELQISALQDEINELKQKKQESIVVEDNNSNITLYDNELKINMTGVSANTGIGLYAENNSALNLGIMTHAFAINGYMIGGNSYGLNSFDVASGKKTNVTEEIDKSQLVKYGISSFNTLDMLFWAYDNDESFKAFDTGQIHTALAEGAQNNLDISGETLYENNGIKVDFIKNSGNTCTYCLTNTSGNYLDFTVENLTVNDFTSSDVDYDLYEVIVLNNCQILFDVTPSNEFMTANGISGISRIEFSLSIKPLSDYFEEWKTDMIVKTF